MYNHYIAYMKEDSIMNVWQLIEQLKELDPSMKVVTTNESACFHYVGNTVPGFELEDVCMVYLDNNDSFTKRTRPVPSGPIQHSDSFVGIT